MTAHNDKVEAVAEAIARARVRSLEEAFPCYWEPEAQAVLTLMEERNWLKADASRSVSSPEAAGRWKYAAFEDWVNEFEGFSTRWTRFLEDADPVCADMAIWLRAAFEAARSESEDTQQAEGAANPSPQLQELIEAAEALDNRIVDYALSIDNLGIAGSRELDAFRAALQNVKKSDK